MSRRVDWLITEMDILGGAEMFVRLAAPRLRQLGWDLRLIILSKGGILTDQLQTESVPLIEMGMTKKNFLLIAWNLFRLWKSDKPDLIHTHLYHAGLLGRIVGRLARIPIIIVHQAGPELFRSKTRSFLDRITSSLATCYVATSETVNKILINREHITPHKIVKIPNGIILPNQKLSKEKPVGWPPYASGPFLGTVGRLVPEKGHSYLLDAFSILKVRGVYFHAIMIGDGILKDYLFEKTYSLQLEKYVSWVGSQSNVQEWLPFLDLFVLPSQWEGISLAILEAMAAGLPVITTAVGGNPEVIENGVTGFLVPPVDPLQLADAIEKLIRNPELRFKMGQAGKRVCQDKFDIDQIIMKLDTLYQNLTLSNCVPT